MSNGWGRPPHIVPAQHRQGSGDTYLVLLGFVLLGYALLGRAFAYVGVPPLYVGEVLLGLGLIQLIRLHEVDRIARGWVSVFIIVLLGYGLSRTLPFIDEYGLDAGRDAMQIGYSLFALVTAGILLERPERLR